MTAYEWDQYGDACFSHDQAALTPQLRAHMIEEVARHNHNERKAS